MSKDKSYSFFLVFILSAFVFQDFFSMILPFMQYFDEMFCLSALPVFLYLTAKNKSMIKINKLDFMIIIFLIIYTLIGIISFFLNSNQPINALVGDLFLNLKFFFSIYIGYNLFNNKSIYKKYVFYFIKFISLFLFFLLLINFIYPIFENQEIRFGIPIPKLFFSHSGYLASAATLLLAMTFRYYQHISRANLYISIQIFIIFFTLRYKAMATAIICTLVFFIVIVKKKKLRWWHILIGILVVLPISWNQISIYYGSSSIENARGALTNTALKISKDLFPFGNGFGNYGSYMSKVYYSDVYFNYSLSNIWGLSRSYPSFISDTFWPMIIGQTGFLGTICYLMILYLLIRKIKKIKNRYSYMSGIVVMIYLLLESTSSSAFVSPNAVPFGLWLGLLYAENEKRKKE